MITHGFVTHEDNEPCAFCSKVKRRFEADRKSGLFFKIMQNKKPTFGDILGIFTDKEILHHLVKLYPDQKKELSGYQKALDELRSLKKKGNPMMIVVDKVVDEEETYASVSGLKPREEMSYGLEYSPWEEWLGMKIHESSRRHYNYLDIVTHCLWELTWRGYTNQEVKDEIAELIAASKEAKKQINGLKKK